MEDFVGLVIRLRERSKRRREAEEPVRLFKFSAVSLDPACAFASALALIFSLSFLVASAMT